MQMDRSQYTLEIINDAIMGWHFWRPQELREAAVMIIRSGSMHALTYNTTYRFEKILLT